MNTTVVYNAVGGTNSISNSVDKLRQSLLGVRESTRAPLARPSYIHPVVCLSRPPSQTVYVMLIALPGYWFAIAFVDRMGRLAITHMG